MTKGRRASLTASNYRLIGRGVYTLAEASRLTSVAVRSIARWTVGYEYSNRGRRRHLPPVLGKPLSRADSAPVLSFLDLIEVRFLNAFRAEGVSWQAIRISAARAREILGRPHPFSSQRFRTDGRSILMEYVVRETEDPKLLNLVRDQFEFEKVVSPLLYESLSFDEEGQPADWWPLGKDRQVVIDPRRSFGAPIVQSGGGIPTSVLARGVAAEGSHDTVAWWYDVPVAAVKDAVEFETSLS